MPSTVTFDMSDPEIKAMIDGWEDNSEYQVALTIRTGAGPQRNVCEVVSVEEEGGAEETAPEEEPETASANKAGASAVSKAMGSMMG